MFLKLGHVFLSLLQRLDKVDKFRLILITLTQCLVAMLDLVGIVFIALIASLSALSVGNIAPGGNTLRLINLLGIESWSLDRQILVLGLVSGVLFISKSLFSLWLSRRMIFFLGKKSALISVELMSDILDSKLIFFQNRIRTKINHTFTYGINLLVQNLLGMTSILIADFFLLIVVVLAIAIAEPGLAIMTVIYFTILGLALYVVQSVRVRNLGSRTTLVYNALVSSLTEIERNFVKIRVLGQKNLYLKKLKENRQEWAKVSSELIFQNGLSKYIVEIGIMVGIVFIAILQFFLSSTPTAVAMLTLFLAASFRIAPAILRIQQNIVNIEGAIAQSQGTFELLEQRQNTSKSPTELMSKKSTEFRSQNQAPEIVIKNITFSYFEDKKAIMKNFSYVIKGGDMLAIQGPNGVGKTTFLHIILGLHELESGVVEIDGCDSAEYIRSNPGLIAFVGQDEYFKRGSLFENIVLGHDPDVLSKEYVYDQWIRFINSYFSDFRDMNLDDEILEDGSNLSGGQRQCLSIFRASLTNPKVLLLDEVTSALHGLNQKKIIAYLDKLNQEGVTIVYVTHRLEVMGSFRRQIEFMSNGIHVS